MNNIIDDSKLKFPDEGDFSKENNQVDVALGGNQFTSNTRPQQRAVSLEEITEQKGEIDGNAQITLTFDQLMELLKKTNPAPEGEQNEAFSPKADDASEEIGEAGTRVIFQAADFDVPEKKKTFVTYDEDDIFNDEEISRNTIENIRKNRAQQTYTPISAKDDRFAVSEVEYDSASLPELQQRRIAQTPPVISSGGRRGNVPYMLNSSAPRIRSTGNVKVEEIEYFEEPDYSEDGFEAEEKPKKKSDTGEIIRKTVLIIAIIAILVSAGIIGWDIYTGIENRMYEEDISNLKIEVPTIETTTEKPKDKKKDKDKDKDKDKTKPEETTATTAAPQKTVEEIWAEVKAANPSVSFPDNMLLEYANYYAMNQDFIGYIEIPGTNLSLPIVQKKDEEDATNSYLNKTFKKEKRKYGCPFLSGRNNVYENYIDYNTVIFGHYMKDKSIFGALDVYKTLDGYKTAPVITFDTLYNKYTWKVIAAFITNDRPEEDNGYKFEYSFVNLSNETYKQTYLNELMKRSIYDTGVDVNINDKLLTLSTCTHEFDNARFVVVARMVRAGESPGVDVSKAYTNSSPRYPQAYYDAKKQVNPYINDNRWYGE